MLDQVELCENDRASFPDNCIFDIDIDFDYNNGQGAWVVILQRDSSPRPSFPGRTAMEQAQPDEC